MLSHRAILSCFGHDWCHRVSMEMPKPCAVPWPPLLFAFVITPTMFWTFWPILAPLMEGNILLDNGWLLKKREGVRLIKSQKWSARGETHRFSMQRSSLYRQCKGLLAERRRCDQVVGLDEREWIELVVLGKGKGLGVRLCSRYLRLKLAQSRVW